MSNEDDSQHAYAPAKVPEERPGREGGRRHLNRLARTRALCEAARDRFLDKGIDAVTIDEVVQAASMSKGSFYRYFDNKEDLVASLFSPVSEAVVGAMERCAQQLESAPDEPTLQAAYATLASELLGVLSQQTDAVRLYLQERHGPRTDARASIVDLDAKVLDAAMRMTLAARHNGLLRQVDPGVSAIMVLGAVQELLWQQFQGRGPADPVAAASELIDLVLHGVTSRS